MRAPIGVDGLKSKNSIQIREPEKEMDHSIILKGLVANTAYDIYCHMDNVKDFSCDGSSCGISLVLTFWTGDSKLITGASLSQSSVLKRNGRASPGQSWRRVIVAPSLGNAD